MVVYSEEVTMSEKSKGLLIGGGVIIIGLLALITNLNLITFGTKIFWIIIFAGAGFLLASIYYRDASKWGVLIPAGILWAIALTIGLTIIPGVSGEIFWTVLLFGFGLSFICIYIKFKEQWWAIIPGGVLITIAAMTFLVEMRWLDGEYWMFIFFLGLGLTFGFLYLVRDKENKLFWAQYPAAALLLISFLNLLFTDGSLIAGILFPAALILLGIVILIRALTASKSS
jgi:hypothetical protein